MLFALKSALIFLSNSATCFQKSPSKKLHLLHMIAFLFANYQKLL
jgi:hypothetical protein